MAGGGQDFEGPRRSGWLLFVPFSRAREILLRGGSPSDPVPTGTLVPFLGVAALAAGFVPARSASRVDPVVALPQP